MWFLLLSSFRGRVAFTDVCSEPCLSAGAGPGGATLCLQVGERALQRAGVGGNALPPGGRALQRARGDALPPGGRALRRARVGATPC